MQKDNLFRGSIVARFAHFITIAPFHKPPMMLALYIPLTTRQMNYTENQLHYFEKLIRGESDIGWRAWWNANQDELKNQLKKPEYLRIKFGMVKYAYEILTTNGVDIEWGPEASREHYFANLHDSVLDDRGYPTDEHKKSMYNGAFNDYSEGDSNQAITKIKKIVNDAVRTRDEYECLELCSLQFDAQMMVESGVDRDFGMMIAKEIASIDDYDDILWPPIEYSRKLLEDYREAQ